MKVRHIELAVLFLVPLAGQQTTWASSENTNHAQVIRFRNQLGEGRDVVFEDSSLTQSEKESILQDYQLLVGHLEPDGSRKIEEERRTTLKTGAGNLSLSRALVCKKGRKKLPDGYENEFGLLAVGESGDEYLVIPRRLSTAYKHALRQRSENEEAFSSLPQFVQFMNNLPSDYIPPIDTLLYLQGTAKKYREYLKGKNATDFIHDYGKYAYAMPSILTVSKGIGELQNTFITEMPIIDKKTGARIGELPLVYHGDRWKILIIIPDI